MVMKLTTGLLLLVSGFPFYAFPGVVGGSYNAVPTYIVDEGREGKAGGTSVVYACEAGGEQGPCVDNPGMCTSQGGRFVGYCFFNGKYEGVCCPGLNPASATLTTRHPQVNDETTEPTAPPNPTRPPPPSTPARPTRPPRPSRPTEPNRPPPPSTPGRPTSPPEPTRPPEPGRPNPPSTPSEPPPPGEPNRPTEPGEPEEPSGPTEPSPPEEPSTPGRPSPPERPKPPETPAPPTYAPPFEESSTEGPTMPPNPTRPPPPSTSARPTRPPRPSRPTEPNRPPPPSTPGRPTSPPEPTRPPEPGRPNPPSTPSEPPPPGEPSRPTEPGEPEEPSGPTEPSPPEEPSTPGRPSPPERPKPPETPAPPTYAPPFEESSTEGPTMPPNPTRPPPPSTSARPTRPPRPSRPTEPNRPPPPSTPGRPTSPPEPTRPPEPGRPNPPSTPSEPPPPGEPSRPTEPGEPEEPSSPTEPSPPEEPSTPGRPSPPERPKPPETPAPPTFSPPGQHDKPGNTPPPLFDDAGGNPGLGNGCGVVTNEVQSQFSNPSYPSLDTDPNVYEYSVVPQDGYCALRVEFLDVVLAGKGMEGCSTDSIVIINSGDSPTTPLCGLLQGYQVTVREDPQQPIKIVVTTQSSAHLWNFNITQIPCANIRSYQDYQTEDCGVKNAKQPPPGISISQLHKEEEIKSIVPTRLLKSKKRRLRDVISSPVLAPSKLLETSVLSRESNIKIVRGNETGVNEYPWQALLMVNGKPLCGASIINEEWVVTAGHCVQLNLRYPLVSVLTVDVGDHDLRTTKEARNSILRVSKIVPNAQNEGVKNDIALIKLATRIQFGKTVRPVCLPMPRTPPDSYAELTGVTTGWGRTEDSVVSPVLREANLPILSNEKCRQQWASVGEGAGGVIDNGMICAGGGEVGPCNGDSGGPLVVQEEDERWSLVGLTSFGLLRGCAVSGVPSVFARVTSFGDWISYNLADA